MAEKKLLEDWSFQKELTVGEPFDLQPEYIKLSPSLQAFHSSMTNLEEKQLEESLLKLGCINPLIVWKKTMQEWILVDGHYRYRICKNHHIKFKVRDIDFQNEAQVKAFMLEEQLGRRNLTTEQLQYYRGLKYKTLVNLTGFGKIQNLSDDKEIKRACELLAKKYNVSRSTILRDAEYAKGLEILGKANPSLKAEVLSGTTKMAKKNIQELAKLKTVQTLGNVKTVEDVNRRLNNLKKYRVDQLNEYVLKKKFEREAEFKSVNAMINEVFPNVEDHLKSLKGQVLSSMRAGIDNRDVKAIRQAIQYLKDIEALVKKNPLKKNKS